MNLNPVTAYGRWLAETAADWPDAAIESAHRQYIDTIAVAIPGAAEEASLLAFETVKDWGAGPSTVIGMGASLAPPWAALVNGTAAHALDFDDNFDPAKAHASAVLVPAIIALAEQEGASGAALLDAYIAGLQILGRVGQGVNPVHRDRGWHATATLGAIGAAAACARLLRLDAEKSAHALSIATSMASGSMAQFGTMVKPLHAGLAAKAGIIAASFARKGIKAGLHTLDGPTGINRLMVGPDYEILRDNLKRVEHGQTLRFGTERIGDPLLIVEHGFRVKRFPNCGSAHRALDGLLALREEHGLTPDLVEAVHVRAPATHLANLMYSDPKNALEAKFSLEYALAVALVTGDFRLSDASDTAVMRDEIRAFYPRLHLHPVDKSEGEFPTEVEIMLKSGRILQTAVAMPAGSIAAPFSTPQYWSKFEGCVAGFLSEGAARDLRHALEDLPRLKSVATLTKPLAGAANLQSG